MFLVDFLSNPVSGHRLERKSEVEIPNFFQYVTCWVPIKFLCGTLVCCTDTYWVTEMVYCHVSSTGPVLWVAVAH
eukprot:819281-Ditylum_brightwellii.AAC.1